MLISEAIQQIPLKDSSINIIVHNESMYLLINKYSVLVQKFCASGFNISLRVVFIRHILVLLKDTINVFIATRLLFFWNLYLIES